MTSDKKQKSYRYGLAAEKIAAWYLRGKGYRILAERYRNYGGEIDIVARRGKTLIAVEVKARRTLALCEETITPWKQQKIASAVNGLLGGGLPRRSQSAFAKATARLPALFRQWLGIGSAKAGKIAGLGDIHALNIRFDVIWIAPWRWPMHIQDAWRL